MKKSFTFARAVLCIAGMAILAGCPQPDTTDPNSYVIDGTVTVEDDVDVTVAGIELWRNGQKTAGPIHPGENGKFSFNDVSAGDAYYVKISITNYGSWTSGSISVPNAPALRAELSKKTSGVSGTVSSDYDGADLTKVKLVLVQAGEEIAETSPASDGVYAFSDLSPGTYFIRASMAMHAPQFSQEFVIAKTDIQGPVFVLERAPLLLTKASFDGGTLYLAWNQSVTMTSAAGFSIAGGTSAITFTGAAVVPDTNNKEWTLTMSRVLADSETITLGYDKTMGTVEHSEDGAKPESFNGIEIKPRLKIVSAEFKEGANSLILKFNVALDISPIRGKIIDELKLSYDGVEFSGMLYVSTYNNSDTLSIILYGSIDGIEANTVFKLAYEDGSIKDVNGNPLANFSGFPVTATLLTKITVKGKVTSDAPKPTDLTKVNLRLIPEGSISPIAQASPDANGSYEFSNVKVEDRTYCVQAILDLHDDAESAPFTIPGQTQINALDIVLHRIPPSLTKARSDNDTLRLTWDQSVTMPSAAGFSIAGGTPAITFTGAAVVPDTDNTQWTLTMSRVPDASETITLSYNNTQGTVEHTMDGAKPDSFTGTEIKRPQPFNIVSAEVTNYFSDYRFLVLEFDADVDSASLHSDGFGNGLKLYLDGSDSISVSVLYNSYGNIVMILFNSPSDSGTVFTLSYSGGTIASVDGDPLRDVSGFAVTNSLP